MNTQELTNLINAHERAELIKAKEQELAMAKRIVQKQEQLDKWNAKIREWIRNMNLLISRGYPFYSQLTLSHCIITNKDKFFELCTDGVYHEFGAHESYNVFTHKMPYVQTLGVDRGGACGPWDLHTDGNTWWIEHESTHERRELRENDYRILDKDNNGLNALERFERKINAVYEYLKV